MSSVTVNDLACIIQQNKQKVTFISAPFPFKNVDNEPIYNIITLPSSIVVINTHKYTKIKTIAVPPNTKGQFIKIYLATASMSEKMMGKCFSNKNKQIESPGKLESVK